MNKEPNENYFKHILAPNYKLLHPREVKQL